ncbi:MAG TPA: response regulator [Blastocatellia bacterium]|jgi:DNA-binding response OmpR family regulator|nr:response regulator [Blastocatellia bacterium]
MSANSLGSIRDALSTGVEKRKHLLCADDNEDTRTMMRVLLEMSGYQVTTTGSIDDALSLIKKGGFDLFILDGIYADGFGVDLCEQIRRFDSQTPIVFLSGLAYESDIAKGMKAGAQAYLTKPVNMEVLEQTIAGLTYAPAPLPSLA